MSIILCVLPHTNTQWICGSRDVTDLFIILFSCCQYDVWSIFLCLVYFNIHSVNFSYFNYFTLFLDVRCSVDFSKKPMCSVSHCAFCCCRIISYSSNWYVYFILKSDQQTHHIGVLVGWFVVLVGSAEFISFLWKEAEFFSWHTQLNFLRRPRLQPISFQFKSECCYRVAHEKRISTQMMCLVLCAYRNISENWLAYWIASLLGI